MIDRKNIISYMVFFIIGFILIFRIPVASFRLSYELLSLYGSISIFSIYLITKKYIIQAMFLLLCMFASYYPICSLTSIHSLKTIAVGVFLYFCIVELCPDKEMVYNVLCAACMVHILFLVLQFFKIEPYVLYGMTTNMDPTGLTANQNEASAMIALCSPCFFRKKWAVGIPFLIIGLLIAKSFGGILAFSLIIGVYLYLLGLKFIAALLFFGLLFVAFFVCGGPSVSARYEIWIAAIKLFFKENLLTGFGLGHWQYISKKYLSEAYANGYFQRAHNTFLQSWFELGPAFILILSGYAFKLYKQVKSKQLFIFSLIAVFISCNVNSAFRMNALNGLIITVWLALIESEWREDH